MDVQERQAHFKHFFKFVWPSLRLRMESVAQGCKFVPPVAGLGKESEPGPAQVMQSIPRFYLKLK